MTTVINLSLLNLNLERPSAPAPGFKGRSGSERNGDFAPDERVIDVTDGSRVVEDERKAGDPPDLQDRMKRLFRSPAFNITYDRHGRKVEHVSEKGILLNSFA